jgi:hypothetical protein
MEAKQLVGILAGLAVFGLGILCLRNRRAWAAFLCRRARWKRRFFFSFIASACFLIIWGAWVVVLSVRGWD